METIIVQLIASFLGVIGFSVMFNIHGKKLLVVGVGGVVCWAVYLLIYNSMGDKVLACFGSTLVVACGCELLARLMKIPVSILLVPMVLPLVPGSDLYYTMIHAVKNDVNTAETTGYLLLGEAGAIALGIILVTSMAQIIRKISSFFVK